MFKPSTQFSTLLAVLVAVVVIGWQSLQAQPSPALTADLALLHQPNLVATAAAPPQLTTAILNGKPIHVLYVTQSTDTVLVRCYPGYAPTITLRAMGKGLKNTQKEGVMTCRSAA